MSTAALPCCSKEAGCPAVAVHPGESDAIAARQGITLSLAATLAQGADDVRTAATLVVILAALLGAHLAWPHLKGTFVYSVFTSQ
jgi:hypothetical protein